MLHRSYTRTTVNMHKLQFAAFCPIAGVVNFSNNKAVIYILRCIVFTLEVNLTNVIAVRRGSTVAEKGEYGGIYSTIIR